MKNVLIDKKRIRLKAIWGEGKLPICYIKCPYCGIRMNIQVGDERMLVSNGFEFRCFEGYDFTPFEIRTQTTYCNKRFTIKEKTPLTRLVEDYDSKNK